MSSSVTVFLCFRFQSPSMCDQPFNHLSNTPLLPAPPLTRPLPSLAPCNPQTFCCPSQICKGVYFSPPSPQSSVLHFPSSAPCCPPPPSQCLLGLQDPYAGGTSLFEPPIFPWEGYMIMPFEFISQKKKVNSCRETSNSLFVLADILWFILKAKNGKLFENRLNWVSDYGSAQQYK